MPYSELIPYQRRSRLKWLEYWRAVGRDTRALWKQFRAPVLAFLLVTFVGGFVYGELWAYSGRDPIALIDRPYLMLQLMILEASDPPEEWYLILFWYALPPVLIFIVGSGVADFVRLFFNRNYRDDWKEAVVSTYRNHVIVLGAGHVGLRVIRVLCEIGVDVVAVDFSPDVGVREELEKLDVPLIIGDGRSETILRKAGLPRAAAFVACTGDDHNNLDTIMRARSLNDNINIVARVWDDDFASQIKHFMQVQSVLSSSELAAPAFAGLALGADITQSIEVDGVAYSTLRLIVSQGCFMDGLDVGTLQREHDMDIVLHSRNGDSDVQPTHDTIVRAGDTLVIFARYERSLEVAARNRYLK